jgi:RNA polymerase sigma factor (TIGR02999 family)
MLGRASRCGARAGRGTLSIPGDEKPGEKRTSGRRAALGSMDAECATDLLLESIGGDREALDRLIPLVYDELRRIAHRELARARPYQTLATTEVVHEVYLRLVDQSRVARGERIRFLAIAAVAMRRIVIEYARRGRAQKRGGGERPVSFDEAAVAGENRGEMLIALDEALTRLRALDDRLARVVECRYFGGLTEEETAEALGVTARTVRRDWVKARAWLYAELYGSAA